MKINEETGLYENYGLWHTPFWQTETFYVIVKVCAGIAVLVLFVVLYKLYIAYKKRKKISAWDSALRDLQTLHELQRISIIPAKEFYITLSSIIKTYLYNRFGYDVLSKTDEEIVIYLQEKRCDQGIIDGIRELLQGSIAVKFANASVAQERMADAYNRTLSLIKNSIPQKK